MRHTIAKVIVKILCGLIRQMLKLVKKICVRNGNTIFAGAKGHVIDPYVLIELFGFPPDCSDQRTRTALNDSGDSPFFDELFEFRLTLPSLALVRFVVLDDDFIGDEFIGKLLVKFFLFLSYLWFF